jgi:hypothetical protein
MRYILILAVTALGFLGCKKDKFNTVPEITFKNISPDTWFSTNFDPSQGPILTFKLTDAEGDFGFNDNKDTSYVYVKNIKVPPYKLDSLKFPAALAGLNRTNLEVNVEVNIRSVLASTYTNGRPRPYTDTLQFEVYVKDFAKNKSNVIIAQPLYYIVP